MDKRTEQLINYISPKLREGLKGIDNSIWKKAEEIRLSVSKPVMICFNGGFEFVTTKQGLYICDKKTMEETIMLLTDNSLYSVNDKLCNGYITVRGGNRVGVVGTTVITNGRISAIRDISTINIRLSREIKGIADKILSELTDGYTVRNTLIISPPQCGKTTLLRDVARTLGSGAEKVKPFKVSVIDERAEIAAVYNGIPENDVGLRTDVLDSCPKHIGIPYVIRSMSPDVVITDEIGTELDLEAIRYAASCGVSIITSAHGDSMADLKNRHKITDIISAFDVFIFLTNAGGTGTVREIVRREDFAV